MKLQFIQAVLFSAVLTAVGAEPSLEDMFENPPIAARPYVWWHWMGPNYSKEGITKDLEAMKAAGIGGATIFNIASAVQESHAPTEDNPWPEQTYRSPAYWKALRHAAREAERLGLEIGLHNTAGYSTTGGPWVNEVRGMQKVVWMSTVIEGGKPVLMELPKPEQPRYSGWGSTGQVSVYYQDIGVVALPSGDGPVKPETIVDLTDRFNNGRLEWDVPAGKWTVIRFGHAPAGTNPHPLPDDLIGKSLEIDKMSVEQSRFHWMQVIEPFKEHLGPYLGKSFRHFLIDSYEAGHQSWTPGFREEFKKRKGYDPLLWMASLTPSVTGVAKGKIGRMVGSEDLTNRFEWDYRDMLNQLYFENGWQIGKAAIKSIGCDLQFEPYGGPFDTIEGAELADLPMGEFWTGGRGGISNKVVAGGRAAGRTVIGAEAFTGRPEVSKWTETPGFLKLSADGSYGVGVNRMILHHWVHQPFSDKYQPGMGMGWWGTHFGRNQTWFEPGKAFFLYLGRVQAMLQRGETPSDFVSVESVRGGSDVMSWSAFRKDVSVKDGQIVLASGRTYPFLSIPHSGAMLPSDVRRIGELLDQGAVIVCRKPLRSPSLADYPSCDSEVKQLAERIWSSDSRPVRSVGKGKLYASGDVEKVLRDLKINSAYEIRSADPGDIRIQHRIDGNTDIFFVANVNDSRRNATVSFRVAKRRPELWDAETGTIAPAGLWRQKEGRTEVQVDLEAAKSVFVVFREENLTQDHAVAIEQAGRSKLRILSARFGTEQTGFWKDASARIQELAARGWLDIEVNLSTLALGDPAPNIVKSLEIDYDLDGKKGSILRKEGEKITLGKHADGILEVKGLTDGGVNLFSHEPVTGNVIFASGRKRPFELSASREVEISGMWTVDFNSPVDKPSSQKMTVLRSLSQSDESSVKYFSGTAAYSNTFTVDRIAPAERVLLDLGDVYDMADVTVNGISLGVLWHRPFVADITGFVKDGENQLRIAVTNTWHNRLVGDEQYPADFEWGQDRGVTMGRAMKAYPEWFLKDQPRPSQGRKGFVIWYYHRADTPLLPTGLAGPVQVRIEDGQVVSPALSDEIRVSHGYDVDICN